MSDPIQELLGQIKAEMSASLEASNAAQKTAEELKNRSAETDTTVQSAVEQATKAASKMQELEVKMAAFEKTAEYFEKMASRGPGAAGSEKDELEKKAREETMSYLRHGSAMSPDTVEAISRAMVESTVHGVSPEKRELEVKTLIAGSDPDGGYFIRPERSMKMVKRIFETSPMRSICDVTTTNSDSLELLIDDDEAASGGWVGEVESRGETGTPKIGKLTIPVHEQFAQPKATQKMVDDAGFDIEAWLSNKVTGKFSRIENTAFVVGDGSQKPKGFLSYDPWAVAGVYERNKLEQIASGNASALTGDGVKNLQNSLIEDYQSGAVFAMNRLTWGKVILLKDGQGNYLLDPRSFKEGDTMTLLGKRVVLMHDMPVVAANALALAYGDFRTGYTVVDRMGFRVIRDVYTAKPYILYYTTKRTGGAVTNYESIKIQKISA